jgi:hypothetical protein
MVENIRESFLNAHLREDIEEDHEILRGNSWVCG